MLLYIGTIVLGTHLDLFLGQLPSGHIVVTHHKGLGAAGLGWAPAVPPLLRSTGS